MRCSYCLFFLIVLFSKTLTAQIENLQVSPAANNPDTYTYNLAKRLHVVQNAQIDTLLQTHIQINKQRMGTEGFRLEIFFSSDARAREQANNTKADFLKTYPDWPVYVQYQSPNFKVRVGDFRTRSEALKVKDRIKLKYPNAFIVKDNIRFPELMTERRLYQ